MSLKNCFCSVIFSTENTENYYSVILLIQEQTVCLKVRELFATCASREVFAVGLRNFIAENETEQP